MLNPGSKASPSKPIFTDGTTSFSNNAGHRALCRARSRAPAGTFAEEDAAIRHEDHGPRRLQAGRHDLDPVGRGRFSIGRQGCWSERRGEMPPMLQR